MGRVDITLQNKPLSTAPYQTDESAPMVTFPMTEALGAINVAFILGWAPLNFTDLRDGCTMSQTQNWVINGDNIYTNPNDYLHFSTLAFTSNACPMPSKLAPIIRRDRDNPP